MNNVVLTHLFPSVSIFKITYNLVVNNATDVLMSKASLTLPLQSGGINQKKKKEGLFPGVVSKNSISLAGYVFIILKISIPELFSRKILCFSGLVFTALNS